MEITHLNVFIPYERKPLDHEDQLTRAFLILVRCVKVVEAVFLELLKTRMAEKGIQTLPASLMEGPGGLESVETQVWSSTKEISRRTLKGCLPGERRKRGEGLRCPGVAGRHVFPHPGQRGANGPVLWLLQ